MRYLVPAIVLVVTAVILWFGQRLATADLIATAAGVFATLLAHWATCAWYERRMVVELAAAVERAEAQAWCEIHATLRLVGEEDPSELSSAQD